ncbi:cytosine deaminase [Leptolyngbya ohadii]|uniref:cytosine deaminase n=1 Tax=Leptolyngbya ohadii TaxID=1962290 RepID=UPI000B5A009C|nr:cytosine deaminase [Leptolyngbya ohadii]
MVFEAEQYWLTNVRVPIALLREINFAVSGDLASVDLQIQAGRIAEIVSAGSATIEGMPVQNLRQGIVFPCFVDLHTHLDKGHTWGRAPNRSGSFDDALQTVSSDSQKNWNAEDVYRRMEFGLKCAYAHGTQAIRTHIDSFGEQAAISFGVFQTLRQKWADRMKLQAASLVSLDYYLTPEGEKLADLVAEVGGVLGGVTVVTPDLPQQLDRLFTLAADRHLDLDIHVDESGNPTDNALHQIAETAIRFRSAGRFSGQIVCGHCCSLAVQTAKEAAETIDLVRQAEIGIVSLPLCNLYLQDRNQNSALNIGSLEEAVLPTKTPRWRGVTLVHELKQAGVPVAFASDNCRDPFYAYGDHDGLEVFTQATRIAQLDAPYDTWSRTVTATPAALMKLPPIAEIYPGAAANLILFKARYYSELFSRPQVDRIVLREGKAIDSTLPDYAELDDLVYR